MEKKLKKRQNISILLSISALFFIALIFMLLCSRLFQVSLTAPGSFFPAYLSQTFYHSETDSFAASNQVLPVGIHNHGNTCYMGAVIQALYRIPAYREIIANLHNLSSSTMEKVQQMENDANEKRKVGLVAEARRIEFNRKEILEALRIVNGLNSIFHQLQNNPPKVPASLEGKSRDCILKEFANRQQQDSDEYFTKVIGLISELLSPEQTNNISIQLKKFGVVHGKDENSREIEIRPEIIDPLKRFSLSIPELKTGVMTLMTLLAQEFADCIVDDFFFEDYTLGVLKQKTRLHYLPETVTIQLKRLVSPIKKIRNPIEIPLEIDFAPFFYEQALEQFGSAKYNLKMFIRHIGGACGGHFVIYVRRPDHSWYLFNDSHVSIYSEDITEDLNSSYMYFYEKATAEAEPESKEPTAGTEPESKELN